MKTKNILVIGLGYVGLPLAHLCSKKGYQTYGIDIDSNKIEKINKGINYLENTQLTAPIRATNDFSIVKECEIIVICVPTPVNEDKSKNLNPLLDSIKNISKFMRNEQLLIIESTVNPNAIEKELLPLIEKPDFKAGRDFYLAHCPERIDPGNKKWSVENIPRVFGALSKKGEELTEEFYNSILKSKITKVSSIKIAEAVKMVENSFRDLNIAFVNELAKSFQKMDIDISEVIKGASTKPFGFLPHYPGCGVGGHCIPVDPYYLIQEAKKVGFEHDLIKKAREINESMPQYTVKLLIKALQKRKEEIKEAKVGVLGLAYKAGVSDDRESPSYKIIKELEKLGVKIFIFDPYLPKKSNVKTLDELLKSSDYIILCTDHKEFTSMEPVKFKEYNIKIIIDGKNCLNKEEIKKHGIIYKGIGIN